MEKIISDEIQPAYREDHHFEYDINKSDSNGMVYQIITFSQVAKQHIYFVQKVEICDSTFFSLASSMSILYFRRPKFKTWYLRWFCVEETTSVKFS